MGRTFTRSATLAQSEGHAEHYEHAKRYPTPGDLDCDLTCRTTHLIVVTGLSGRRVEAVYKKGTVPESCVIIHAEPFLILPQGYRELFRAL